MRDEVPSAIPADTSASSRPIAPRTPPAAGSSAASQSASCAGVVRPSSWGRRSTVLLADLAMLSGRPVPSGRLVVAIVAGRVVAAVRLAGGQPLADPFERTEQLVRLLELRAAQLREVGQRRSLLPCALGLLRHA